MMMRWAVEKGLGMQRPARTNRTGFVKHSKTWDGYCVVEKEDEEARSDQLDVCFCPKGF